jgi:two-component system, OmpR family, response regulator MprA
MLVVDDECGLRQSLRRSLTLDGYHVLLAENGREALVALARETIDAVILDVNMPVMDGLETCRALRASGNRVPILMLTARGELEDRVDGLDAGADDYLSKPFALAELRARLRALLRRADNLQGGSQLLAFRDLSLDPVSRRAWRGDRELELTKTEFNLLELFVQNPGRVLLHSVIFERIWGYDFGRGSKALVVYIGYLRQKMEAGGEPRLVHTLRGVGYRLDDR